MFKTALLAGLLSIPAAASADQVDVIRATAARHPAAWAACHRDYPQGPGSPTTKAQAELFIRLAAWDLHQIDPRYGLNGKRGNPNDLSQDVISYQIEVNWNQGYDVVAGAGGDNPSIVWNAFPEPGTDAQGFWVAPRFISQAEIDDILAGGESGGSPQPPPATVDAGVAAVELHTAFVARVGRTWEPAEVQAIADSLRAMGWDGGSRVPKAAFEQVKQWISRYSGDLANPLPTLSVEDAAARLDATFRAKFDRGMQPAEVSALQARARQLGYVSGPVPVWLIEQLEAAIAQYNGELYVVPPTPVASDAQLTARGKGFALAGEKFEWHGETAFLLAYDYFFNRAQYVRFRDAAVRDGVTVLRISVATSSGYLTLEPRSGGTYGLGRTTPLFPGSPHWNWQTYRDMVADLNAHGIVPEIVVFLTTGPEDLDDPRMASASGRMAYLDEAARELLPIRAAFVEIANEYNFIGFPDDGAEIVALWNRYKKIDPTRLVAMSAPSGPGDTQNAHLMAGGDYITVHADRRTTPRTWSWVIHQLGLPQLTFGKPVVNDEGINADTVGEFGNDATPANHWANGVLTQLTGLSYTFHYDRALKGLEPAGHDGSLAAIQAWKAGIAEVPFDPEGTYVALANVAGADAVVARLAEANGYALFLGVGAGFTPPAFENWQFTLVRSFGPHRLYSLSR